jgi:hypothetical protein
MSAATVYRLHSWNRGGPLCGQVSPNGQCNVRYAVDDHGRDVPAWVTCQRCLRVMHDDGADPPEYQHGDEPNLAEHEV